MPAKNRSMIDAGLKRAGFGGLSDPNLFNQIAWVISCKGETRGHASFRSMLLSAEPEKRKLAYDSIAPKLSFVARPLESYLAEGAEIAEKQQLPHYDPSTLTITEWKPQEIETEEYKQTKLEEGATRAIAAVLREENAKGQLYLVCRKCTREQTFRGKRKPNMLKLARQEGWYVSNQEVLCIFCKPRLQ